jgi:predicted permease
VGKRLWIDHHAYTIIGVAPREFHGHQTGFSPDIWTPMNQSKSAAELNQRDWAFFSGVMARLKPSMTTPQAQAAMTALYRQVLAAEVRQGIESSLLRDGPSAPPDRNLSHYQIAITPGAGGLGLLRDKYAQSLRIAMSVVGLVLLIACSNVANLMLARATTRRREIGLRLALGSGRLRLTRQLLTESVLVALAGGVSGLVLAHWLGAALADFVSISWLPMSLNVPPDVRMLLFTTVVSLTAALLFGLVPAWQAMSFDVSESLKGSSRTQCPSVPRRRFSRVLLVSQVALSLILATGAGLLVRGLVNLHRVDPGFRTQDVLMLDVHLEDLEWTQGKPDFAVQQKRRVGMYRHLEENLNALPGVRSASLSWLGLFGGDDLYSEVTISGVAGKWPLHENYISSRYFDTLGMQIMLGRGFTAHDDVRSAPVAVINEALARKFLRDGNPLGKFLTVDIDELRTRPLQIVGVLRDAKYSDLRDTVEPMFYAPLAQVPLPIQSVEVRTAGDLQAIALAVKRVLQETDRNLMVRDTTTLSRRVDGTIMRERMLAELSGIFSVLALMLASAGMYGTMAYAVSRRTGELGIRMALGAGKGTVLWMVLSETLILVAGGIAIGAPAALVSGRIVASYLFGLRPADPVSTATAALLLVFVGALAGYLPARKAARVDPMVALRYE